MKIDELTTYGISSGIVSNWKESGMNRLLPVQSEAVQRGVLEGASLLVVAPTSSGKTFIAELAAIKHAMERKKTLYLVPFKAIAEEKFTEFESQYGGTNPGLVVRISDRDHRETDREICVGDYDIGILTYEKPSALLAVNNGMLDVCDCVIVDEVQMNHGS